MNKRILSLSVTVFLMFFFVPFFVFAAEQCTLSVANTTIIPGGTGTVNVSIKNNPGIIGMSVSVSWDDGLTLTDAKSGDAFSTLNFIKPHRYNSGCIFTWYGEDINDTDIKDADILILSFSVDEKVQIGQCLSIRIDVDNAYDKNLEIITPVVTKGAITTAGSENANACVCGEIHTGPLGGIITFLHKIIYMFKRIFGIT